MDILIVEDVRADFLLVQRHLHQRGLAARCFWASDLAEVEAALSAQRWGVVLSDYKLPGIRFLDLLALFKQRQPDVPVILVSGNVGEETAVDLLKEGLWDFVLKDNLLRLVPIIDRSLREAWGRVARRQAEATLHMVDTAMNASANAVMITDPQGLIEWTNAASATLTGYSSAESVGKNPRFLRSGDEPDETYADLWATISGGRTWRGELRNRRKDGTPYFQYTTISPVHDLMGVLAHYVSVSEDVTVRKAMEAALAESQRALQSHKDHLEEVVTSRTAEAERLSHVKSDFLANMSHEIRTPLHAMLGMAQVGWHQSEGTRDEATYASILGSGRHLLGILDGILDFSKIEAGMLHLAAEPVELARVLGEATGMMATSARNAGIGLRFEAGPSLPARVLGDALRISQVVVNLVSNAVKFTTRGEVTVQADRVDGLVTLRVVDTGAGMTPQQLARLFVPFEQGDTSTTRRFGGTGLGLAITLRLVEQMQGTIEVSSVYGVGSSFTVRLPLPDVPAALPVETPPEPPRTADDRRTGLLGIRVLGVDDNEANRHLLQALLSLSGAVPTIAENGAAAFALLEALGEAAFDIVVTDIQMPDMDGHALARKIRSYAPTLPVIGLTAHAMEEERRRCVESGIAAHLSKPVDLKRLVSTIRAHARVVRTE